MLQAPDILDPERILAIGSFGAGKTNAWLEVAAMSVASGSPARFFVIDSDDSVARMTSPGSRFERVREVMSLHKVNDWTGFVDAAETIVPQVQPHDWVVADFVGSAWSRVQDYYIEQVFGDDPASYFLSHRQSAKSGNPLDGWKDWSVINRLYDRWFSKLTYAHPGHVFFTAVGDPVSDLDSKEIKSVFGGVGMKPRGQKHLGHAVHTILALSMWKPGEWHLTTIKDRERELHRATTVTSFVSQYLMGTAGWSM